jgi:hypothetical protein
MSSIAGNLRDPLRHNDGPASIDHHDGVLIDFCHGLDEVVLSGRQIERFDVKIFRLEFRISAHHDDGSICFCRGVDGFISELLSRLRSVFARIFALHADAQCIAHLQPVTCSILNTFQRSN